MELGVATHFGQGWPLELMVAAAALGADFVRDQVHWEVAEREPGLIVFAGDRLTFPDAAAALGLEARLLFSRHNRLHDAGTPHSEAGLAAYGRFIGAALDRFPAVRSVEVWNEVNARNFVAGPVRDAPYALRAQAQARLTDAAAAALATRSGPVTLLGGATHSLPVDWLAELAALGGLARADGVAAHPYTSPPEHVGEHLALLADALGDAALPVHATEFGREGGTPREAADHLVRMATALSAGGAVSATWYALAEQPHFPNMGLVGRDGAPRPAGEAFALMAKTLLPRGRAERAPEDPFTYVFRYGDDAAVLWGEPRAVAPTGGGRLHDATGRPLPDGSATLDPSAPLVLLGADAGSLVFGLQTVIADSFHEFRLGPGLDRPPVSGPWSWRERRGDGAEADLVTIGGGRSESEAWRPHLGGRWRRPLGVDETGVRPVDFGRGRDPARRYAVVERWRSAVARVVDLCASWRLRRPAARPVARVEIAVDGRVLFDAALDDAVTARLGDVAVPAGGAVAFTVDSVDGGGAPVARRYSAVEPGAACPTG